MIDVEVVAVLLLGACLLVFVGYYFIRMHRESDDLKSSAMVRETIKEEVLSEPLVSDEIRKKSHEFRGQSQRFRGAMNVFSKQANPIEAFIRAIHQINGQEHKKDTP